jgi:hypothetical protein
MSGFDDLRNKVEGTPVQPSGTDNLRQEYLTVPRQPGTDAPIPPGRIAAPGSDRLQPNSIYSQSFDNPIVHLNNARAWMKTEGLYSEKAQREYLAAIRAADTIDQREVAQERKRVADLLNTEQDPNKRRQLVQWDATLHDMQRAPGFTRANLGMQWIRAGKQADGIRLLVEAGNKDPEMRTDPNFIKHMRLLNMQVPTDRVPSGPGIVPTPGDGRPVAPTDQTGKPTGAVRPEGNFDNPMVHLATANSALEQGRVLTPQIRAEYLAAIKAADQMDRTYIQSRMKTLDEESRKTFDKPTEELIVKLTNERDALKAALEKEHPDSYKKLGELDEKWSKAKTDDERNKIVAEMRKVEFAGPLLDKQKELETQEANPKHTKFIELQAEFAALQQLDNSSSLTRFAYAFALANNAKQADSLLNRNLTDPQRAALNAMAEQQNLNADQKTFLKGVATQPSLTEEQRTKLKELANGQNLSAEQKAILNKMTGQFNLTDSQKTQLQQVAAQDRQQAAGLLDQIVKIDPDAASERAFVMLAKEVGYKIPEAQVSDKVKDQAPTVADLTKTGHPINLLEQAHATQKEKDFAQAKPVYQQAVEAADKLDPEALKKKVDFYKSAVKDENLDAASRQQALQLAMEYISLQHSPFVTRFQYAIGLSNAAIDKKPGGDAALAKQLLDKAKELDPEAADSELYRFVKDKLEKGQKISDDDLKKFAPQQASNSEGAPISTELQQVKASMDKVKEAQNNKNAVSAEAAFKEAIAAADKMDMAPYKQQLELVKKQVESLSGTAEGITKSGELLQVKKALEARIQLPVDLRLEMAKFYIQNQKPDLAKAMLEDKEFLKNYPDAAKRPDFKLVKQFADEYCKSTLDKAMEWAAKEGKGLVSDFGSGGLAAAIFAMNPEAAFSKRLLLAVGAAALAKPGMQMMMGEKATLGDAGWGAGMGLMFIAGGEAKSRLTSRLAAGIDETLLKEQLLRAGVKESLIKDFAVQQDLRNVDAIGRLLKQQFGEQIALTGEKGLKDQALKLGISEAAVTQALEGKTGRAAVDAWVKLLEGHSISALDNKVLLASAEKLGLDAAAIKEFGLKQEAQRVDVIASMLKERLGDKVDGKKLIPHAEALGIAKAEATALEGKTGTEAVDAFATLLKQRAEAGSLNMSLLTEKANLLGVDKFQMTKAFAAQERASIDLLGDLLKKDLTKVDAAGLATHGKAMGIAEAELKKLEGKSGAELVDTFTTMLKAKAETGLSLGSINELAATMGVSQSALRDIVSKRKIEVLGTVEKLLAQNIDDQRRLAKEAYGVATQYKLEGLAEGNGQKLAAHLKKLGVAESDLMLKLEQMRGAEASKTAVALIKDTIATREKLTGEALAAELKDKPWLQRVLRRPAGAAETSAYAMGKKELDALRSQVEAGRVERLGSWAKSWLPWNKGQEGTIYREYADLWAKAATLQGRSFGPVPWQYLNPNHILNVKDADGWRLLVNGKLPGKFRDFNAFGSLNDLHARSFWNKYKVDFATIGAMSLMYRGASNGLDVVRPNEKTGKTISVGDALVNTGVGSLGDATLGAFMMPVFREIGGAFTRRGSLAESLAPTRAPWQQIKPGVWSKLTLPYNSASYVIGEGMGYVGNKVGQFGGYLGGRASLSPEFIARNPGFANFYSRIPMGLSTVPGNAAIFSPRLQEVPGTWSLYSSTAAIIDANNQPLKDENKPVDPLDEMEMEVDPHDVYKHKQMELFEILGLLQQQQEKEEGGEEQPANPPEAPAPKPAPDKKSPTPPPPVENPPSGGAPE